MDYWVSLYIIVQGASAVPKKTVRASESNLSVTVGGLDSLPREDISGKITPTLLKSLESPDWKVWVFVYINTSLVYVILMLWMFSKWFKKTVID
jgi:hypothetical protein